MATEVEGLKASFESERSAKVVAEHQAAISQGRLHKTEAKLKELVANIVVASLGADLGKLKASLDEERAVRWRSNVLASAILESRLSTL